ncbi:MAG: hypothetical protein ABIQ93_12440, partial [Saprospiraceae bacterium]
MKRPVGIILIVVGLIFAVFALTRHEDEKTILDLGKVEVKAPSKSPSDNTTIYYVIAAVCVIAGGAIVA